MYNESKVHSYIDIKGHNIDLEGGSGITTSNVSPGSSNRRVKNFLETTIQERGNAMWILVEFNARVRV